MRPGNHVCAALPAAMLCALLLGTACSDDATSPHTDAGTTRSDAGRDASTPAQDAAQSVPDAGPSGAPDAGHDAGHDAGLDEEDAGSSDAGTTYTPPTSLADTGLYGDFANETLATGVHEFAPSFALWSDGATKRRYLYLPPNTKIDTSDMDAWVFPVGTKAWKEFTRDGIRVETRLLEKVNAANWYMVAFIWNQAQTEAIAATSGMNDANGTQHDVPASGACRRCHDGSADTLLGVAAIQLSHQNAGLNLEALVAQDRLSDPPAGNFALPGTATDEAALGALHANCGHCHNPRGSGWDIATGLQLLLLTTSLGSVTDTTTYITTVDQTLVSQQVPGATYRVLRHEPDMSALVLRLEAARGAAGSALRMPPIATEEPDPDTAAAVRTWVTNLAL